MAPIPSFSSSGHCLSSHPLLDSPAVAPPLLLYSSFSSPPLPSDADVAKERGHIQQLSPLPPATTIATTSGSHRHRRLPQLLQWPPAVTTLPPLAAISVVISRDYHSHLQRSSSPPPAAFTTDAASSIHQPFTPLPPPPPADPRLP
ncbi:proline-rich receptor-like protein kinase PERK14 [Zingiber officinale]|uniref:proline-rich receptor-like protein kinase PERK14 n=1 Tax=Zingiber officinale TaxID=94328 RepID=UPI001C4B0361|nr:proline-rich receptor-like protein kinase PERK14 [Zingiber officinale]